MTLKKVRMMSDFDLIEYGKCPNNHGEMFFFNHPIDIITIIPDDVVDLEGTDAGDFGYIVAICQECGFVLTLQTIDGFDDYLAWLKEYRKEG